MSCVRLSVSAAERMLNLRKNLTTYKWPYYYEILY